MKKYFYQKNGESYGPYTVEDILKKKLDPDTYVWYDGLESWIPFNKSELWGKIRYKKQAKSALIREILVYLFVIIFIGAILVLEALQGIKTAERDDIIRSAYNDPEVDFNVYLNKFYRDVKVHGSPYVTPNKTIIKFANLDKKKGTVDYYGISYGYNDDSKIEIYINPTFWANATKAQKYWLMYHELCHDVLNIDHTPEDEEYIGELMYPYMDQFGINHMDDFIEAYHSTFERVAMAIIRS